MGRVQVVGNGCGTALASCCLRDAVVMAPGLFARMIGRGTFASRGIYRKD